MKWLLLSFVCFNQFAFASEVTRTPAVETSTTTPVEDIRLAATASFYNDHFQTAGALVSFVTEKNKAKGDELAAYMKKQQINADAKMPRLVIVNDHLEVEGYKGPKLEFTPNAHGGMKVTYDHFSNNVNVTMTLAEMQAALTQSEKSKSIRETMINMVFPTAEAQDFGSTAALAVGSFGVDLTSVVYGSTYAGEEAEFSIRKKIRNFLHGRVRESATEACDKIQEGKTVKNTDKIIEKLQTVKKEINCIQWWPATSTGSCAWYDAKITCLQEIQGAKGDDSSRKNNKPAAPVEAAPAKKSDSKAQKK